MAKKVLAVILLFILLFNIKLSILPINIMAIAGPIGFFYWIKAHNNEKRYEKQGKIIVFIFVLFLLSIFTSIVNEYFDFYFFQEVVLLNILRLFAAYGIVKYIRYSFGENFGLISFVSLLCIFVTIQLLIAYISFMKPDFYYLVSKITASSELEMYKTSGLLGSRPFGIGNYTFFGAGVFNCIFLCLLSFCISHKKYNSIWLILCYVIVSVLGTIIARTTLVGVGLSLTIFLLTKYGKRSIFKLGLTVFLFWVIISNIDFNRQITDKVQELNRFGFELFLNYSETGELQTSSSNHMFTDMYIFPTDAKTWVVGDGRFRESESVYYMRTDVGFLRLIYYFGVSGLLMFLYYQYYLIKNASRIFVANKRAMALVLFLLVIVLNLKGFTDFSFYLFLLINLSYHCERTKTKSIGDTSNI